VRGRVLSARVEPHPQLRHLHTVVVVLRVDETLKGQPAANFAFRQYIWDPRDRLDAAGYRKGQHLLLLMNRPTPLGLASPAGLEQGRFRVVRDAAGNETLLNGAGNHGLLRNLAPQLRRKGVRLTTELAKKVTEERAGPLALDEFRELVRHLREPNGK